MSTKPDRTDQLIQLGIEHCRLGEWDQGLVCLSEVFRHGEPTGERAGLACSHYGHAIARCEGRVEEGLELCERGLALELFRPEVYLNLARTWMLARNRPRAVTVVKQGLDLDPDDTGLIMLNLELGSRQGRTIPFLARSHPVNRFLGRLRHRLKSL